MFPARTPGTGLPASFKDLIKPPRTLISAPEDVQRQRRAFIDEWLNATAR
jgi:thiamine transport system substrate-binding protein